MPDEHGRLLDELLELRSMAVAVQRSGEVIVRNHIFAISFSGLPHTVPARRIRNPNPQSPIAIPHAPHTR